MLIYQYSVGSEVFQTLLFYREFIVLQIQFKMDSTAFFYCWSEIEPFVLNFNQICTTSIKNQVLLINCMMVAASHYRFFPPQLHG